MKLFDYIKSWPLFLLPQHAISRLVYRLTRLENRFVPQAIRLFIRVFQVDMREAQQPDVCAYPSFNAFFTRALAPEARQWVMDKQVLSSPVDGCISQVGSITQGNIFQAKNHQYSVTTLLGGDSERAAPFLQGEFMTIYLSPRDYHRVHMPIAGELHEQVYIPGQLFSVAPHTVRTIPNLFARNERVVALFNTEYGKLAMVLVGAINVAAIETVWDGLITPPKGSRIGLKRYSGVQLAKGQEMGRFNMGSTVILLLEQKVQWDRDSTAGQVVRLGQALANLS